MLPKDERLRKSTEFREVLKNGRVFSNRAAVLYVVRTEDGRKQFGVSVGRRVGSAVRRNRVKRLFRESFRLIREEIPAGTRMLFIARAGAVAGGMREIAGAVRDLARKAGLVEDR